MPALHTVVMVLLQCYTASCTRGCDRVAQQQLLLHREIQDTLFSSLLPAIRLDRATRPAGFAIVYTLLKHPTRFSHPRSFSMPVWHLPADCLTFFLGRRGSICHCVGAVHNTGAVVCDMGWDGMALPYRDYLICTVQSTRCIRSTQPTGSLVRRPLFPLRPTSPALSCDHSASPLERGAMRQASRKVAF